MKMENNIINKVNLYEMYDDVFIQHNKLLSCIINSFMYMKFDMNMLDKYIVYNNDVINYLNLKENIDLFYNSRNMKNYHEAIKNINKIKQDKKYIFNGLLNGCLEDNFRYLIDNYLNSYMLNKIIINKKDNYIIFNYNKINLNLYYFIENLYEKNNLISYGNLNTILAEFYAYDLNGKNVVKINRKFLSEPLNYLIHTLFNNLYFNNKIFDFKTLSYPNVNKYIIIPYIILLKMINENKVKIIDNSDMNVVIYCDNESKKIINTNYNNIYYNNVERFINDKKSFNIYCDNILRFIDSNKKVYLSDRFNYCIFEDDLFLENNEFRLNGGAEKFCNNFNKDVFNLFEYIS